MISSEVFQSVRFKDRERFGSLNTKFMFGTIDRATVLKTIRELAETNQYEQICHPTIQ